jgi:diacylglycerol kinase family enzyme
VSDRPAILHIVLNASGREDGDQSAALITGVLRDAGQPYELLRVDDGSQLEGTARRAVDAARASGGAIVAAGGDGTLNTIARVALDAGCPYGVIPQGTFNYFARAHGIPTDTTAATRALLDTRLQPVPVGLVNDRLFLVNASVGLYPEALELREAQKQRHGRSRPVALWATLLTVLQEHRPMRLRLKLAARTVELSTLTLFVGLNRLQIEQMGWDGAVVEAGRLAAIVLKPVSTPRLLWMLLRGAFGRLAQTPGVESFAFVQLTVSPAGRRAARIKVATDGETLWMRSPLEFSIAREPLRLLLPRTACTEPSQ